MMKRKVKPAGYRVLVKLKKYEEKAPKGAILLLKEEEARMKREQRGTQEAYVIEIGPTAFKRLDGGEKDWCQVGDCVLITKYSGDDLDDIEEGEIYRVINDQDIEAIFPEEHVE